MTATTKVIRTVTCPLETSERKNAKLQQATAEFERAARAAAALLPSFPEHEWARNNGQIYRAVRDELGETNIKAKVVQNAVHRVVENYRSARESGNPLPTAGIPDCDFVLLTNQGYDIEPNDRGFGLKAKFVPHKPEWWHLDIGAHQREYLDRVIEGDARLGQAELAYNDGDPLARVAVSWEQAVTEPADAEYVVGVDLGYNTLAAAAVREYGSGDVVAVDVHPASRFQHHRKRLQRRRERLIAAQKLDGASKATRRQRHFTDAELHRVANGVVELAAEWRPAIVRLEDITDYREQEREALHDWPFHDLRQKITEKARAEGIGVEVCEPYMTSRTCRKCGHRSEANRDGRAFECRRCGYEVNADVNAAMNIATA